MFFFTFDLFTLIVGGVIVLAVLWVISTINGFKRREIKIPASSTMNTVSPIAVWMQS